MDLQLHVANLGSTPAGTHTSHGGGRKDILPKLLPCASKKSYLDRHVQSLEQGSQRR